MKTPLKHSYRILIPADTPISIFADWPQCLLGVAIQAACCFFHFPARFGHSGIRKAIRPQLHYLPCRIPQLNSFGQEFYRQ